MDTSQVDGYESSVCIIKGGGSSGVRTSQVGANESNGGKIFQLVQNIVFIKFSEVCNSDWKIFFFAIFKNFFL